MDGVGLAPPTIFSPLQPIGIVLFVLGGRVVPPFALTTRQRDNGPHSLSPHACVQNYTMVVPRLSIGAQIAG